MRVACSECNLRELCLAVGLDDEDLYKLDDMVTKRKLKRGQQLYRAGDSFDAIYAIRTGFFKTDILTEEGLEQVTGFQMAGEILGMDGISTDRHVCNATALEDSEVCLMPYDQLEELSRHIKSLQQQFHKFMSREIVRDQSLMILLGSMRAEERIAAFLLNLSQRFTARGYSHADFFLRMEVTKMCETRTQGTQGGEPCLPADPPFASISVTCVTHGVTISSGPIPKKGPSGTLVDRVSHV